MIVHISMGKYKESAGGRTKAENIALAKEMTEALVDKIPGIIKAEVGLSILGGKEYDAVAYSEYEDMDAVKATLAHPAHDELVAHLQKVVESSHSVTYEREA
jgi:hypothetical protein